MVRPPLSHEEKARSAAHRAEAKRGLKLARVLGESEFADESRAALLKAAHALSRAIAIESRLPEPPSLEDALLPPLSMHWNNALTTLRQFVSDAGQPWRPAAEALETHCAQTVPS